MGNTSSFWLYSVDCSISSSPGYSLQGCHLESLISPSLVQGTLLGCDRAACFSEPAPSWIGLDGIEVKNSVSFHGPSLFSLSHGCSLVLPCFLYLPGHNWAVSRYCRKLWSTWCQSFSLTAPSALAVSPSPAILCWFLKKKIFQMLCFFVIVYLFIYLCLWRHPYRVTPNKMTVILFKICSRLMLWQWGVKFCDPFCVFRYVKLIFLITIGMYQSICLSSF